MRNRIAYGVVALVAIALGIGVYFSAFYSRPKPSNARRSDVVHVQMYPWPEGPAIDFNGAVRGSAGVADIELIRALIPDPLPPSLAGKRGCSGGRVLVMELKDGRVISYGHCKKPKSILDFEVAITKIYLDYNASRQPGR